MNMKNKNRKTLTDIAVDGIIPSVFLPSTKTMYDKAKEALLKWKKSNYNYIS